MGSNVQRLTLSDEQQRIALSDEFLDLMNGIGIAKNELDAVDMQLVEDWWINMANKRLLTIPEWSNRGALLCTLHDLYWAMVEHRFPPVR